MEVKEGEDLESGEWVLDSLVGYLRSPIWQEPLVKFLEDKSVVFGPEDEEEWQVEFDKVFEEYKDLIDSLLEIHMKEMDITPEQFEDACQMAEGVLSAKLHQNLFEQIWAASDFDTFKRMMIQLNIDLQLHALEVLASKYGLIPDSFLFEGMSRAQFEEEDTFFKEAVRRSLAEIEAPPHIQNMVQVHQIPESAFENDSDTSTIRNESTSSDTTRAKDQNVDRDRSANNFMQKIWHKAGGSNDMKDDGISVDEIKSRQEYLRKQRDKLLEIKKEERKKQLERMEENAKRPKTARPSSRSVSRVSSVESGEQEKTLKYRQSLAARIKSEIVDSPDES